MNIYLYKYRIKEVYFIEEEYKNKKRKDKKKVKQYRNPNFDELISKIEAKKRFTSQKKYNKDERIYLFDSKLVIKDNDDYKIILYQFKGGVDSERSNILDHSNENEKTNNRDINEVEKKVQTLVFIFNKKNNEVYLLSERREGLLDYKKFFKLISNDKIGYETQIISSNEINKIQDSYKAIEVITEEKKEDIDGRYFEVEEVTNLFKTIKGDNLNIKKYWDSIKDSINVNKKNKIIFINDNGNRLTINGNSFHDRIFFDSQYSEVDGGFLKESIKLGIEKIYMENTDNIFKRDSNESN